MAKSNDFRAKRKQLFVDPKVQGALLLRAGFYWLMSLTTVSVMLLCWRMLAGPSKFFSNHFDDLWFHYAPVLVVTMALMPVVLYDVLRISNRFTGPMFRMRRALGQLARGEEVKPLRFRDGDFWQEVAEEFNAVAAKLKALENAAADDEPAEDKPDKPAALTVHHAV